MVQAASEIPCALNTVQFTRCCSISFSACLIMLTVLSHFLTQPMLLAHLLDMTLHRRLEALLQLRRQLLACAQLMLMCCLALVAMIHYRTSRLTFSV